MKKKPAKSTPAKSNKAAVEKLLRKNSIVFMEYNDFRKKIFLELAPKEGEGILYLLPWLLSINYPNCPGYLPDWDKGFWVHSVDSDEIKKRESTFKKFFNVKVKKSLLKYNPNFYPVEGIYTIGSIGSIGQTAISDCDLWVCFDMNLYTKDAWSKLNMKLNLIKDWMDANYKIPAFFFISDVNDIRKNVFGSVDEESSGSAQRNVLKEEFYRTCIVVCGKIPFWWVCWNEGKKINYDSVLTIAEGIYGDYSFLDLGNLEYIEKDEFFGAVLWQYHKSLSRPLKSIMKMILLKIQLEVEDGSLMCHELRNDVLSGNEAEIRQCPNAFSMEIIFKYYQGKNKNILNFLKECFYLRCELKPYAKKPNQKKEIAGDLFTRYDIDIKRKAKLVNYNDWKFNEQIELGERLFKLLLHIYKEIFSAHSTVKGAINQKDLTVLGRKIAAKFEKKENKIPVLQKPMYNINVTKLIVSLDRDTWRVFPGSTRAKPIVESTDIVFLISFMVWNGIFHTGILTMEPNPTSVTIQEIINVGNKIKNYLGSYDNSDLELSSYLKAESVYKLLVIVSFEKSPWEKEINDFSVIYKNTWGELFVKRIVTPQELVAFVKKITKKRPASTSCYVQRNSTYYEKIIDRTKKLLNLTGIVE